jgi:hypothetical protein
MKGLLFLIFLLLIVIAIFYFADDFRPVIASKESFTTNIEYPTPELVIPKVDPPREELTAGDFKGYAPPAFSFLAAPPGKLSSFNSLPYQDPALEKAPFSRIKNLLTTAMGFLKNEAPGISQQSDPAYQLPLTTLRGDVQRLQDESACLVRNPGIQSQLTQGDVDGIEANLTYLQRLWRNQLSSSAGLQVEGFQDSATTTRPSLSELKSLLTLVESDSIRLGALSATDSDSKDFLLNLNAIKGELKEVIDKVERQDIAIENIPITKTDYDTVKKLLGQTKEGVPESILSAEKPTLNDLKDLIIKVQTEITRLSSSGTTDSIINNRISKLTLLKNEIQGIINKVEKKTMSIDQIPITKVDFNKFLPLLANPRSTLPDTLQSAGLPISLASLFPAYQSGDISGAQLTQYVVNNYLETFFKGLSWDLRMNYTAERLKEIADAKLKTAETSLSALDTMKQTQLLANESKQNATAVETSYRGDFASRTSPDVAGQVLGDGQLGIPKNTAATAPSTLDWKERSQQICTAIAKRGYTPGDFGCFSADTPTQKNFSYRGYAKMVCSRLETLYDTSAPEACGCPPPTWAGWRQ